MIDNKERDYLFLRRGRGSTFGKNFHQLVPHLLGLVVWFFRSRSFSKNLVSLIVHSLPSLRNKTVCRRRFFILGFEVNKGHIQVANGKVPGTTWTLYICKWRWYFSKTSIIFLEWNGIVAIIDERLIHARGNLLRPRADTLTGILRKTMA